MICCSEELSAGAVVAFGAENAIVGSEQDSEIGHNLRFELIEVGNVGDGDEVCLELFGVDRHCHHAKVVGVDTVLARIAGEVKHLLGAFKQKLEADLVADKLGGDREEGPDHLQILVVEFNL